MQAACDEIARLARPTCCRARSSRSPSSPRSGRCGGKEIRSHRGHTMSMQCPCLLFVLQLSHLCPAGVRRLHYSPLLVAELRVPSSRPGFTGPAPAGGSSTACCEKTVCPSSCQSLSHPLSASVASLPVFGPVVAVEIVPSASEGRVCRRVTEENCPPLVAPKPRQSCSHSGGAIIRSAES